MKKDHCRFLLPILGLLMLLAGCSTEAGQRESEAYDETVLSEATTPETTGILEQEPQPFVYSGEFGSSDGSVIFSWNLEESTPEVPVGAVDVIPHNLTEEDARRIAQLLFEDAVFYAPEETFEEEYSKKELQKKLDIWKQYTDPEKMTWLYLYRDRPNDNYIQHEVELVGKFLEEYSAKLESAPEEKQDAIYDWTFQMDGPGGKGYFADCEYQGIPYRIRSNGSYFSAYLYTGAGPSSIEEDHYRATLCRTEEPGETQVAAIREKALSIARKMELGEWCMAECTVESADLGNEEESQWEYTVNISLMPSFDGMRTISWGMHTGWTQEGMEFVFAPGGELLSFSLEKAYSYDGTAEMPVFTPEELLDMAQKELAEKTNDEFGVPADWLQSMEQEKQEKILCKVNVCVMKYGLAETSHPTHAGKLRFQPAMLLYGMAEYVGAESGTVYMSYQDYYGPDIPARRLLAISAVDGSLLEYPQ